MENDNFWQWCGARKKLFTMNKIQSMGDGFSAVIKIGSPANGSCQNIILKGKQCIHDSSLRRSSTTVEGNALKSRGYSGDLCLPVRNSVAEVSPFQKGDSTKSPISVIRHHVSSSGTNSDSLSDHQHGGSGSDGQFLRRYWDVANENSVEDLGFYDKKQQSKSGMARKGQKPGLKRPRLFADDGITGSSGQYAASNREPSVEASSSYSISKVAAEDMELQSPGMHGELRDLSPNYIDWPCHPPATKKPKKDQGLVSMINRSSFQIENQKDESENLFEGLHLLADVAVRVRSLEKDPSCFTENIPQKEGIRKAIFIPIGAPFSQKKAVRRTKGVLQHHQPDAPQTPHDLQKNLSAANSKPLLTSDSIGNLDGLACIKQSENLVAGNGIDEDQIANPQLRSSKRVKSQALPTKYCDSVLHSWKKGTR